MFDRLSKGIGFFNRASSAFQGSAEQDVLNKLIPEVEDLLEEIPAYAKTKKVAKEVGDILGVLGKAYDAYGEKKSFFGKMMQSGAKKTSKPRRKTVKKKRTTRRRAPMAGARYSNR